MNKSRWVAAIGRGESVVLEDNDGWRVLWRGELCTPSFNSKGAADACLQMYERGQRAPEL